MGCQSPDWADLKATYRLFDTEEATFEAICEPQESLVEAMPDQAIAEARRHRAKVA
jgi:hypothetical protein